MTIRTQDLATVPCLLVSLLMLTLPACSGSSAASSVAATMPTTWTTMSNNLYTQLQTARSSDWNSKLAAVVNGSAAQALEDQIARVGNSPMVIGGQEFTNLHDRFLAFLSPGNTHALEAVTLGEWLSSTHANLADLSIGEVQSSVANVMQSLSGVSSGISPAESATTLKVSALLAAMEHGVSAPAQGLGLVDPITGTVGAVVGVCAGITAITKALQTCLATCKAIEDEIPGVVQSFEKDCDAVEGAVLDIEKDYKEIRNSFAAPAATADATDEASTSAASKVKTN